SGTLVATKIATAWVCAFVFAQLLPEGGMVKTGFFAGLSVLAIVAAMDMTNAGLYASLMQEYGTKEEAGASVLISLESGPLMTMIILGSAGQATFEPEHLAGVLIPFLVGFLLGNLDPELRELFSRATKSLIPFFAFALGNTINLGVIIDTGLLGILMALAVIVITGVPLIIMDIMLGKGRGTAGIAASSTAGAAVATPLLVAEIAPDFAEAAPAATTLVASCVVITAIVVPVITALWAKHGASRVRAT
ncbi:TPA: 2-keto-3-deoxygluconate permease, partial [Escherichia coli]